MRESAFDDRSPDHSPLRRRGQARFLAHAAHIGATAAELAQLYAALYDPVGWFGAHGVRQILAAAPRPPDGEPRSGPPPLPEDGPPEGFDIVAWPGPPPEGERPRGTEVYVPKGVAKPLEEELRYVVQPPRSMVRILPVWEGVDHVPFLVVPYCMRLVPGNRGHRNRAIFSSNVHNILSPHIKYGKLRKLRGSAASAMLTDLAQEFIRYAGKSHRTWNILSVMSYIGPDHYRSLSSRTKTRHTFCHRAWFFYSCAFLDWLYDTVFRSEILWFRNVVPARRWAIGWLMTGDGNLHRDRGWGRIYRPYLKSGVVLQAPHHGAEDCFPRHVPRRTAAVFATCKERDPRHPGPKLVHRLDERSLPLMRVTDSWSSMLVSLEWL